MRRIAYLWINTFPRKKTVQNQKNIKKILLRKTTKTEGLRLHFVFEKGMLGITNDSVWTSDKDGKVTRHDILPEPSGGSYGAIYGQMLKAIDGKKHYPTIRHGAKDVRIALAAYASAEQKETIDLRTPEWTICG